MSMNNEQRDCQIEQIASYLDGELDTAARLVFESHIKECSLCAAELAGQRRLLGALDSVLSRGSDLPLPTNFARIVATNAESDMSGMRERREGGRALRLCAVLAATSLALLGLATRVFVFNLVLTVGRPIAAVFDLVWTTIGDAVTSFTVILRVLGKSFLPGSQLEGLLGFALLALAVLLLSRLIASYHRTRFIE
jgi:anti-sigma factor RsiW